MSTKAVWGCVVAAALAAAGSTAAATEQGFTYSGERGPSHWGELSAEYAACGGGTEQSPIDFGRLTLLTKVHRGLVIDYGHTTGRIVNNGHTVEVETEGENLLEIDGEFFQLVQFHFHNPSEHRFTNRGADMELHLVHRSDAGHVAVVGVLMERGPASGALALVFDHLPQTIGVEEQLERPFNPASFLPRTRFNYRYAGSLTTPPCTEGVRWIVMAEPVSISDEHIAEFAARVSFNARPVRRRSR